VRKQILPEEIAKDNRTFMAIPDMYRYQFELNPEKALKDLAGIPPKVGDAFISLDYKIIEARERWVENNHGSPSPVQPNGKLEHWFRAQENLKRAIHVDIGYASEGDAMGIAMGHVRRVVEIDGELKPYIVIDMLMRLSAPAGGEIMLGDMRRILYHLRDGLKFNIVSVTFDGFQSHDTIQQMRQRRFRRVDYLSIDKEKLPYEDLREAIYEDRIEIPPLMTKFRPEDPEVCEIAYKELSELIDTGPKIDHPEYGSKDVADAIAGVTYALMGDRRYKGAVVDLGNVRADNRRHEGSGVAISHPAFLGGSGQHAPVPPASPWSA
jgi:hypothetical protein